jgi:GT2 family glycosyltransferase
MITHSVSIVIPTYNRRSTLSKTLEKCETLIPQPSEIIVVDDASTDDTKAFIHAYNKSWVRYIRLPENRGQAYARSVGMATAQGEIIVSLDDDSYFMDVDALERVVRRFEESPQYGILVFKTFTPRDEIDPPENRLFYVSDHVTGGCAYRKSLLDKIGYHLLFIHSGGEETDLSLKTLDAGYSILLDYSIRVFHDFEPDKRSKKWRTTIRRQTMRNDLLEVWVRFPWVWVFPATLYKLFSHFRHGLQHHLVIPSMMGFLGFLIKLPIALMYRKPVSSKTLHQYLALRKKAINI